MRGASVAAYLVKPSVHLLRALGRVGQIQRGIGEHVRTARLPTTTDRDQRCKDLSRGRP